MNRLTALIAAIALGVVGSAYALYTFTLKGDWPATWPKELEPLRAQARTLVGPQVEDQHFGITFTKREEIEAAWPYLLKVLAKGAPVRLVRGANFFLGGATAGVVIHCPPADKAGHVGDALSIELVIDGNIVDLNRLPLPADTPIADERFKDAPAK